MTESFTRRRYCGRGSSCSAEFERALTSLVPPSSLRTIFKTKNHILIIVLVRLYTCIFSSYHIEEGVACCRFSQGIKDFSVLNCCSSLIECFLSNRNLNTCIMSTQSSIEKQARFHLTNGMQDDVCQN